MIEALAELGKNFILNEISIVVMRHFVIQNLHGTAAPRIAIRFSLELVLEMHDLPSTWPHLIVFDETGIEQFVHERVTDLLLTDRHVEDIRLCPCVLLLLILVCPLKWILFDNKVVEAAPKGPDVNCPRR